MEKQKNVSLENKIKQLDDTMIHIGFVLQAGHKLARQLFSLGEDEKAMRLLQRILQHDQSKVEQNEFYGLAAYAEEMTIIQSFGQMLCQIHFWTKHR